MDKKTTNEMANLTRTFRITKRVSQYYKPTAESYLADLHETLNIVEEPEFQYYLPIKWDVPFPPPENPKFKFI